MGDRGSFATFTTDIGSILERRAAAVPERRAYTFIVDGKDEGRTLTYGELYRLACIAASVLRQTVNTGDRVLLMHDDSLDFIVAFMACIFASVIAVPIPPPDRSRLKRTLPRIQTVIADCGAVAVLANLRIRQQMQDAFLDLEGLRDVRWLAVEDAGHSPSSSPLRARPEDLAFLQYTSGSTSAPKGVMVSHGNILDNLHKLQQCFRYGSDSATVTWMPYFHDYGLIDGLLEPLYAQAPCHIISPVAFIKRPWCWLDAVSRYRATHIHGPNFAYELCLDRTSGDRLDTLDLSCLEVAGCAAEPIRHDTARRFIDTFARCGFREKSFFPAYGMAEATLVISAKKYEATWSTVFLAAEELEKNQCVDVGPGHPRARAIIGCGVRPGDFDFAIVEPDTGRELADSQIGEIWLANPSVAIGYWNRPEETRATFHAHTASGRGPMLRTGDLGFTREGEIYVTGRLKDLVIINGNNHYPQDIERTVEMVGRGIRPTCVAAFSLDHPEGERLVIVAELARREEDPGAVIASIRSAVSGEHDISCWAILLLPRGSIHKTSSGKVQRNACRQVFLSGQFTPIAEWRAPSHSEATANAVEPGPAQEWEAWLRRLIAKLKHIPETQLDPTEPFTAFGLSSVEAVEIAGYAEEKTGRSVPATALWEYPNIRLFARFLSGATDALAVPRSASSAEPVAIIGMACKFPGGADSLDDFWNLLCRGESVFSDPPAGRFPQDQQTFSAAWLHDIFRFDAEFFGISDAEARAMDPQQRLLLETAWHALEDAGTPPAQLAGRPAGVFIGISSTDYAQQVYAVPGQTDRYAPTGTSASVIANRLSYFLDLRGPSLTIDTACSASLVAVNQACMALQSGAADIAVAGGVNALLSHGAMLTLREAGMLSPTGCCRPFDAAADGYVRGEGCGVIILKKLADAQRDGNRIWAIIHGSEVMQDGRSNGLTAPSGLAQQAVVRGALARAGIGAGLVEYVEAHGTGTVLGDSIELRALAESYGRDGSEPCRIGAVKSCVGHLEGAAGIAGLIKTVLALSHETIPPNPQLTGNGVHADICGTRLALVTGASAWPARAQRRFAAVSSFGFGGTLAHVVLSDHPHRGEQEVPDSDGAHLLAVSARNPEALRTLVHRYARSSISPPQLCAAAVARTHFACRAAFVFRSRADLFAQLSNVAVNSPRGNPPARVAFVFNRAVPQPGVGDQLYQRFGVFRERVDDLGDQAPVLLRFQLGLVALWQSWGVEPDVVLGEGGGEFAAAVAAGVLSPEAAVRLAVACDTPAFPDCLRTTTFAPPVRPIFSSTTGLPLGEKMASPEYWLHQPGAAAPSVEAFHGIDIAIGMNAVPAGGNPSIGPGLLWVSCLDSDRPETESLLQALGRVYAAGFPVRWEALYPVRSARPRLPLYPFGGREHRIAAGVSIGTPVLQSLAAGRIDDVVDQLRTHHLLPDTAVETLRALSVLHQRQSSNKASPLETWVSEWVPVNIGAPDHGVARPCVLMGDGLHRDRLARAIDRCAGLRRGEDASTEDASTEDTSADRSIVLIYCCARDEEAPDEAALRLATDVLEVLQALRSQQARAEIWAITQGLREGACVWGLGKTAALEMTGLWGGLVDLPSNLSDIDADNLLRMITCTGEGKEDQLCLRDGQWFASRLVPREIPKRGPGMMLRPDAVYWIPGGTGTLGGHVVRMLREQGARHIIVSARSEGSPGQPGVRFVRADVCSRSDIARVLEEIDATRMPLAGVVHVAGTVTEFPIERLTPELFRDVAATKVTGAWNLHEATQGRDLDFFVCFSSIASLWGAPGQAHYAAGNHFLDNLCLHRRSCGQPALAINWGPWSGGGMVTPERLARLSKAGLDLIHPGEALELLGTLMASGVSNFAAARLGWEQFGPAFTSRRKSPFLSNLFREPVTPAPIASRPSLLDNWRNASPDLLRRRIRDHIRTTVAEFLGEGRIPETDRGFFDMGLDSLAAVAIRNRFVADFGLPLSNADVFNFPSIDALTTHILDLLTPVHGHQVYRDLSGINLSQIEMMNSIAHDFEMLVGEDNKD